VCCSVSAVSVRTSLPVPTYIKTYRHMTVWGGRRKRTYVVNFAYIIRLHRMCDMQTIVTVVSGVFLSVCLSVCLLGDLTRLYCAKTAEQIKILFRVNTLEGPSNIVLDGILIPHRKKRGFRCSFRQITLSSCYVTI